jgi:hypothetical protein
MRVLLFYASMALFVCGLVLLVVFRMQMQTDFASLFVPVFLCVSGIGTAAFISCLYPEGRPERLPEEAPLRSLEIEPPAET